MGQEGEIGVKSLLAGAVSSLAMTMPPMIDANCLVGAPQGYPIALFPDVFLFQLHIWYVPLSNCPNPRPTACRISSPAGLPLGRTWARMLLAIHLSPCPPDPWEIPAGCPQGVPSLCPLSLFSSPLPPVPIQIAPGQIQLHREEEEEPATQLSSDLTSLSFPGLLLMEKGELEEVLGDVWA